MIDYTQQRELFESWLQQEFSPLPDYALRRQIKNPDLYSTPVTQWRWETWIAALGNQQ